MPGRPLGASRRPHGTVALRPMAGGRGGEPGRGDGGGCAPRFSGERGWQGAGVGPQRSPSPRVGLWGTSSPHDGDGAGWVQTCSGRAGLGLVRCPTASAPLHQSYSMAPLHLPLSQSHRTGPTGTLEPDATLGQVPACRHRRFCQCQDPADPAPGGAEHEAAPKPPNLGTDPEPPGEGGGWSRERSRPQPVPSRGRGDAVSLPNANTAVINLIASLPAAG